MHDVQLLNDIGIAVLAATVLGLLAHALRQPIILGYLCAGAIIGPQVGLAFISDQQSIETISEIGLILLLFIIGLELNVTSLRASGRQLLITGFGQFPLCVAMGVAVFAAMGFGFTGSNADGLYLALMCALSSTAIVVKLLYDKGELDTLPGRTTLGVLVIQDVYAIFVLAFQPNFASPTAAPILKAMLATCLLLGGGLWVSRYLLKRVFASIAKSPEMVVAVSLGWCAAVAGGAGAMHLSKEMGALVAGLTISAFPYSIHVTAKTLPLRDFFLTLFFVSLGMKIVPPQWSMLPLVGAMISVAIVSRFLSVYPLLKISGAGRRTAFISSLNLAQISEFSLVIGGLGVAYQHISDSTLAVTIYSMAITAVLSSYAIRYNHQLYLAWDRLLALIGFPSKPTTFDAAAAEHRAVAILGFFRVAGTLVNRLAAEQPQLLRQIHVVDFNPDRLERLAAQDITGTFGDISSVDTLEHAHLNHARLILCTVPDMLLKGTSNQSLVKVCRALAPHAIIVATADNEAHERLLRSEGADEVINPHDLAALQLARLVATSLMDAATEPVSA